MQIGRRPSIFNFLLVALLLAVLGGGERASAQCAAADFNSNGVVGGEDLAALLGHWNTNNAAADLNNDGVVAGADLAIVLGVWGPCGFGGGGQQCFIPASVRVVDYDSTNNNILVRGSCAFGQHVCPAGSGSPFQFSDLINAITSTPQWSSLPPEVRTAISGATASNIIDFCLIGSSQSFDSVQNEVNWFSGSTWSPNDQVSSASSDSYSQFPNYINGMGLGTMVYWPVSSFYVVNPPNDPNDGRIPCQANAQWGGGPQTPGPQSAFADMKKSISKNYVDQQGSLMAGYNFGGLVDAVHAALTNQVQLLPSGNNTMAGNNGSSNDYTGGTITNSIIYVHCDSGVNRTGAVIAAYLMKYGSNLMGTVDQPMPGDFTPATGVPLQGYTMCVAQEAANSVAPANDTPNTKSSAPGGADLQIAMAYKQVFLLSLDYSAFLPSGAIPRRCIACLNNSSDCGEPD